MTEELQDIDNPQYESTLFRDSSHLEFGIEQSLGRAQHAMVGQW
jgi:hypothetical protein